MNNTHLKCITVLAKRKINIDNQKYFTPIKMTKTKYLTITWYSKEVCNKNNYTGGWLFVEV